MLAEQMPEFAAYPHVQAFVQGHLAMQFGDVRAMLRLPLPHEGITNGCNFPAASWLCNLVSGISVVLYNSLAATAGQPGHDRGQRFRELLRWYYPWLPAEDVKGKITVLYLYVRNPFAHSIGVLAPSEHLVTCRNGGATREQVQQLDVAYDSGAILHPALELVNGIWELNVPYFYAGALCMLRRLASDGAQMQRTEQRFMNGQFTDGVL
jgi:hypothetical protein